MILKLERIKPVVEDTNIIQEEKELAKIGNCNTLRNNM